MQLKAMLLGTNASMPTKDRNPSGFLIQFNGEHYLFDCGEGTQQQFMKVGESFMKLKHIFISHWHGDHWFGLFGMLATMGLNGRTDALTIHGPKGVQDIVADLMKYTVRYGKYPVHAVEVKAGIELEENNCTITAVPLKHSTHAFGFVFQEKGKEGTFDKKKAIALGIPIGPLFAQLQKGNSVKVKGKTITAKQVMDYKKGRKGFKISYVCDTLFSASYLPAIKESDLLVHEATFSNEEKERAKEILHSTAEMAATAAKKAKVKKLVLTHFSSRFVSTMRLVNEAKKVFKNTVAGKEGMEFIFK